MTKQRLLLAVVAGLVIIGSLVAIYRRLITPRTPAAAGLEWVGSVAAEETVRLLSGKGQVLVIYLKPLVKSMRWAEYVRDGFIARLDDHPEVRLVATEVIALGEPAASSRAADYVRQHGGSADAVVLIGGGIAFVPKLVYRRPP